MAGEGHAGVAVTCGPSSPGVPGGPTSPFFPCVQKKPKLTAGRERPNPCNNASVEMPILISQTRWSTGGPLSGSPPEKQYGIGAGASGSEVREVQLWLPAQ